MSSRAAAAAALAELGRKGSPGAFLRAISRHKTGADGGDDPAFALYQEKLEGKLDFDDLLLETLRQWEGGQSDRRFTHLLVDEFQDIGPASSSGFSGPGGGRVAPFSPSAIPTSPSTASAGRTPAASPPWGRSGR